MRGKKSIAFIGSRGVPASYSGFETFVEEAGWRLAERGWKIRVYNRTTHIKQKLKFYRGMEVVNLPTLPFKSTDTIVHSFLSVIHLLFHPVDIVYVCGVGSSVPALVLRLRGMKVVINVDGPDWQRDKWGILGKWFLRLSERISLLAGHIVVADALAVKEYYKKHYNGETVFIPYGSDFKRDEGIETLEKFHLKPDGYFLFVGRLVPENNAHCVIKAFKKICEDEGNFKLVIVGDAPYAESYKKYLRKIAGDDERIIFTGYQFGKAYRQLSSHTFAFILASKVGGTHPVLVEQMGFGNSIIAGDTPANIEVLANCGLIFNLKEGEKDLAEKMKILIRDEDLRKNLKQLARERAMKYYSWESVVEKYEEIFRHILGE